MDRLNKIVLVILFVALPGLSVSQGILEANGPGETYELINNEFQQAGSYLKEFDISGLVKGIYLIRLTTGNSLKATLAEYGRL